MLPRVGAMMHPPIRHAPDPDHPGWWTWDVAGEERYNSTIGKLLLRETGHLAFLRGTVEQEGRVVASWTGTLRKGGPK